MLGNIIETVGNLVHRHQTLFFSNHMANSKLCPSNSIMNFSYLGSGIVGTVSEKHGS